MKISQVSALGFFAAITSATALPVETQEVATRSSDVVLSAEKIVLTDADVHDYPEVSFGEELEDNDGTVRSYKRTCKVIPSDREWPSKAKWSILNFFAGKQLEKPDPIGDVCFHGPAYNAAKCANVTAEWSHSDLHMNHPTSIMSPLNQGMTCLPVDGSVAGHKCSLGGYPVYVVNARNAKHIQAAVNFARNMNIRLVVKNTGHDFHGKASGFGSLSIRTHYLKDIVIIKKYQSKRYTGPAIKAGSGVQGFELYAAAHAAGLMAVAGEGVTVGWGGGYIQGGGHSPLSSIHGMAADQVLAYEVVLSNGRFVTVDPDTNSDLFWAMRGGGGGTFGVLVSIIVKVFPDKPVTISTFTFGPSPKDISKYAAGNTANDDFWTVIKHYFSLFPKHADKGIYSYFTILPNATTPSAQTFTMLPFFAPGKTVAEVNALLASTVKVAKSVGVSLKPKTVAYPGFYEAWKAGFPQESIGLWNVQSGSRLFPRHNWDSTAKFDAQFDAIREVVSAASLIAFNIAPTLAAGKVTANENAVLPAWRNTVMHAITGTRWNINIRDYNIIRAKQKALTDGPMQRWRDVSPGSGVYLAECDYNEPNRQEAFWGSKYPRLYKLKHKYDPLGVFFTEIAVGSEDWRAGNDHLGRLCPV